MAQSVEQLSDFIQFYDDSSDEDDTTDGLSRDIIVDINSFIEKYDDASTIVNQKSAMTTSFINYSFGLALYNATTVKNTYQIWKKEHLGECVVAEDDVITSVFDKIIENAIKIRVNARQHSTAVGKLTKECLKYLWESEVKNVLLNCLKVNLRLIIRCITVGINFPENILQCMKTMDTAIYNFFTTFDYSTFLEKDFDAPLTITDTNLYREMKGYLKQRYQSELDEKDFGIAYLKLNNLITPTKQQISTSSKYKPHAKYLSNQPAITRCQKEYFLEIYNATKGLNLRDFNNQFDENFLTRRMQELIDDEKKRGQLSIIQDRFIEKNADFASSKFHEYEEFMDAFKSCTIKIFRKFIDKTILAQTRSFEQAFLPLIKKAVQKEFEPYTWRSSLSMMHVHNIKSIADYMASLRLTRRSLYRTYRNQSLENSVLGKSKEEHHDIGWQFKNIGHSYIAIEQTRITAKAYSSLLKIETRSNKYIKLGEKIEEFLIKHPAHSNRDIARWMRQIITGSETVKFDNSLWPKARHDLTLFLVQLAHLFVGTESIRYPAALVQSQMIMDLIEADCLTWSKAFTVAHDHIYYPMILEKATSICRTLAAKFKAHSFYSHKYPGETLTIDNEKVSQYITAECQLTIQWLKLHNVSANNNNEIQSGIITQTILHAIPCWYANIQVHH